MEKIDAKYAYQKLITLFENGGSNDQISFLATQLEMIFDYENSSQNSQNVIYDLMSLDMPGAEFNRQQIKALIEKLTE